MCLTLQREKQTSPSMLEKRLLFYINAEKRMKTINSSSSSFIPRKNIHKWKMVEYNQAIRFQTGGSMVVVG